MLKDQHPFESQNLISFVDYQAVKINSNDMRRTTQSFSSMIEPPMKVKTDIQMQIEGRKKTLLNSKLI